MITFDDFMKVEICAGIIIKAEPFPRAAKPAYKVWVDFGPQGVKQTSAQITRRYQLDQLVGKRVMGCINLPQKNIAGFISEFLLLGFAADDGSIVLATPDQDVPKGQRLC